MPLSARQVPRVAPPTNWPYDQHMSFEGDKERLVRELAEAQAEIRAQYGLAKRDDSLADDKSAKKPGTGKREPAQPS